MCCARLSVQFVGSSFYSLSSYVLEVRGPEWFFAFLAVRAFVHALFEAAPGLRSCPFSPLHRPLERRVPSCVPVPAISRIGGCPLNFSGMATCTRPWASSPSVLDYRVLMARNDREIPILCLVPRPPLVFFLETSCGRRFLLLPLCPFSRAKEPGHWRPPFSVTSAMTVFSLVAMHRKEDLLLYDPLLPSSDSQSEFTTAQSGRTNLPQIFSLPSRLRCWPQGAPFLPPPPPHTPPQTTRTPPFSGPALSVALRCFPSFVPIRISPVFGGTAEESRLLPSFAASHKSIFFAVVRRAECLPSTPGFQVMFEPDPHT